MKLNQAGRLSNIPLCIYGTDEIPGNAELVNKVKAAHEGKIKGMICMGQNPAVGGPNCGKERLALEKLDWLVCADIWNTETANFWNRPVENDTAERVDPRKIKTEVPDDYLCSCIHLIWPVCNYSVTTP